MTAFARQMLIPDAPLILLSQQINLAAANGLDFRTVPAATRKVWIPIKKQNSVIIGQMQCMNGFDFFSVHSKHEIGLLLEAGNPKDEFSEN